MKTYKNILNFTNAASAYMQTNPKETKLKYALEKVIKRSQGAADNYFTKRSDLELEYAATDKDGCVLYDNEIQQTPQGPQSIRKYRYTKEGIKQKDEAIQKLYTEEGEDIEPHFASEIPKDLEPVYMLLFRGFVIDENTKEEKLKKIS